MEKPNCYECKHCGDVPGSAHRRCRHPKAEAAACKYGAFGELMAIMASVRRVDPITAMDALNVKGHPNGIRRGWFNWPWNFDPAWLENCDGFEAKATKRG